MLVFVHTKEIHNNNNKIVKKKNHKILFLFTLEIFFAHFFKQIYFCKKSPYSSALACFSYFFQHLCFFFFLKFGSPPCRVGHL